jgi:hypothetical protein
MITSFIKCVEGTLKARFSRKTVLAAVDVMASLWR